MTGVYDSLWVQGNGPYRMWRARESLFQQYHWLAATLKCATGSASVLLVFPTASIKPRAPGLINPARRVHQPGCNSTPATKGYSTVTLFARFRGLSTSHPRATAM